MSTFVNTLQLTYLEPSIPVVFELLAPMLPPLMQFLLMRFLSLQYFAVLIEWEFFRQQNLRHAKSCPVLYVWHLLEWLSSWLHRVLWAFLRLYLVLRFHFWKGQSALIDHVSASPWAREWWPDFYLESCLDLLSPWHILEDRAAHSRHWQLLLGRTYHP